MSHVLTSRSLRWLKNLLITALASLILLAGLLVGGVRLLDHFAPQYRHALADRIGQRIDAHIDIKGLAIGWSWHGPVLYLQNPRVRHKGAAHAAISADRIGLIFSPGSLIHGSRLPDGVLTEHLHIRLKQDDKGIRLLGWTANAKSSMNWDDLEAARHKLQHIRLNNSKLSLISPHLPDQRIHWSQLNLALDNQDEDLQLSLDAHDSDWWSDLHVNLHLQGSLQNPRLARFQARGDCIQALSAIRRDNADFATRLAGGELGFKLRGAWQDGRLHKTRLTLQGQALTDRKTDKTLVPGFTARLAARSHSHQANLVDLDLLTLEGGPKEADQLAAKGRWDMRSQAFDLRMRHLPGPLIMQLARHFLPDMDKTRITGHIPDLDLAWRPDEPLAMTLGFQHLAVNDPRLAFGPISGRYRRQGTHNSLHFRDAGGQLKAADFLKGELDITGLSGDVHWQPDQHNGWQIQLDRLRLASHRAHITTSGQVHWAGADQPPWVDLKADATAANIRRLLRHIPQGSALPKHKLRQWLGKAILAGTLDRGHVAIKGPLDHRFPYTGNSANRHFRMTLQGHGIALRYKKGWPRIDQLKGHLDMTGARLRINRARGRMLGVNIGADQVEMADIRDPILDFQAHARRVPAPRVLAFLQQSPLRDKVGQQVRDLQLHGLIGFDVGLHIPLKPELGDIQVDGQAQLNGLELKHEVLPRPLRDIRGQLHFSKRGISSPKLTGYLEDIPVLARITPTQDKGHHIQAQLKPRLPADQPTLAHYLPAPWLAYGQGQARFDLDFTLGGKQPVSPIHLRSNLEGLALNLPAPLTKKAAQAQPLRVAIEPGGRDIQVTYGSDLQLAVQMNRQHKPRRIIAKAGSSKIKAPPGRGIWLGGQIDEVDGAGWLQVLKTVLADKNTDSENDQGKADNPPNLPFLGGDLRLKRLALGTRHINRPHIWAVPMHDENAGWRVDFTGPDSQGQLTWIKGDKKPDQLAGSFKRLALQTQDKPKTAPEPTSNDDSSDEPESKAPKSVLWPELAPDSLPSVSLYIQDLLVDKRRFGRLHVDAKSTPGRWQLQRLALEGGAMQGQAQADWQRRHGLDKAALNLDGQGKGLYGLLHSLGINSPLRADKSRVNAQLRIHPNPNGLDLSYLHGKMRLALDKGTILSVNPGPARLLGLLNLYELPRRLLLDFSDITETGLPFEKIRGHFRLRHGQAYTDDAYLKTSTARIGMAGRLGLATRDYDEMLTISPEILGSGATIIGTALGGPIAGAAVFAFQEVFKNPIRHLTSVHYHLKGSWDEPRLAQPRADDDKH